MSNVKSPTWYGGGLGGFMLPGANLADNGLFYVDDVNGTDTAANNNGLTPNNAFQTITYALTQCTAGDNNYIIVLHYADDPTLEAWPISVDVDNVSLIGAQSGCFINTKTTVNSDGDTSCLLIEASHVLVQGFRFQPGTTASGITFAGHRGDIAILDCNLELGNYGVYSPDEGVSYGLEVSRCVFVAPNLHGIYIDDNPGTCRYKDNVFHLTIDNSVGIEINAGGNDEILDNRFGNKDASPVHGWAITMSGIATDAIITGNHCMIGMLIPGASGYKDTTGAGTCNWGLNYDGTTAVYGT